MSDEELPGMWEWADLAGGEADTANDAMVCVTHLRHIPCRRGPEGCRTSTSPDAVLAVRNFHAGRAG